MFKIIKLLALLFILAAFFGTPHPGCEGNWLVCRFDPGTFTPSALWNTAQTTAATIAEQISQANPANRQTVPLDGQPVDSESPELPDATATPGAVLDVSEEEVCAPGYAETLPEVPARTKRRIYADYSITPTPGGYEIDHLISIELGGSNSVKNLWPQSYYTLWNARVKNRLESTLHRQVCNGDTTLEAAQQAIADDWVATYKRVFNSRVPVE